MNQSTSSPQEEQLQHDNYNWIDLPQPSEQSDSGEGDESSTRTIGSAGEGNT